MNIAFAPICTWKKNRRIWRHNADLAFTWRHKSTVVTSQCYVRRDRPWRQWRNERSMIVFLAELCVQDIKIVFKIYNNAFVTLNNDFWSPAMWFSNDFHAWLCHSWKSLVNTSSVTINSLFTITHALFHISPAGKQQRMLEANELWFIRIIANIITQGCSVWGVDYYAMYWSNNCPTEAMVRDVM